MILRISTLLLATTALCACASAPTPETKGDEVPVKLSRDAVNTIEREGEAEAALAGTRAARKSDLVCRTYKRTGSHMTEAYCYSRREQDQYRERIRQELDSFNRGSEQRDVGDR